MDKVEYKELDKKISFGSDWLNVKLEKYSDVSKFFSKLHDISPKLAKFNWQRANTGIYNYSERYLWHGMNGLQIAFNPLSEYKEMTAQTQQNTALTYGNFGIFVTISGSAMRELENLAADKNCLSELMYFIYKNGGEATRFDTYLDCFDPGIIPMETLHGCFENFYTPAVGSAAFSTNFFRDKNKKNCQLYREVSVDDEVYFNYQLGGHGSRTGMCRIYNKFDEQRKKLTSEGFEQLKQEYGFSDYWVRFEFELHKERANQAFKACMEAYEKDKQAFNYSGLWLSSSFLFFRVVFLPSWGYRMSDCPTEDSWDCFISLITDYIHFVQLGVFSFSKLPYIRESINRQVSNDERIMFCHFKYAVMAELCPQHNYHYRSFIKFKDNPKFIKWCEDAAAYSGKTFVEVQQSVLRVAGIA